MKKEIKSGKKRKEKFSIKEEYRKSWDYVKESKNFIYAIIMIFFVFSIIGFFIPIPFELSEKILEYLEKLFKQTQDMSQFELTKFIFFNNLQSSFFGVVFGAVFGLFPIISSIFNGYILGFVGSFGVREEGIFILFRILPHGIFELPAIFISLGMGLKLGFLLIVGLIIEPIKFYWNKNRLVALLFVLAYLPTILITLLLNLKFRTRIKTELFNLSDNLWSSLKVFIFIIIPLLLIAAIIEGILIFA